MDMLIVYHWQEPLRPVYSRPRGAPVEVRRWITAEANPLQAGRPFEGGGGTVAPTHNQPPSDKAAQPGVGGSGPKPCPQPGLLLPGPPPSPSQPGLLRRRDRRALEEQATGFLPQLPFPVPPLGAVRPQCPATNFQREYNRLFEVGSGGPPCPLFGGLYDATHAGDGGAHPLLQLLRPRAWRRASSPTTSRSSLEFMHYLTYKEAEAQQNAGARNPTAGQKGLLGPPPGQVGTRCCARSWPSASRCPSRRTGRLDPKISWGGTVSTSSPCSIPPLLAMTTPPPAGEAPEETRIRAGV